MVSTIIDKDAGNSHPPPSAEKSQPLFKWTNVAPIKIGKQNKAVRRVCIPKINVIPPMISPNMTK